MLVSFVFRKKMVPFKVVHPLRIYQVTKFLGPTLTGVTFAFTSEVCSSTILEWLQLQH
jgi:hypothetical protein